MCVIIQAKKVKRSDLAKILEELRSNFNYLIVSNWRDIHFVRFDPKHHNQIPESDRGRAFGAKSELRWRRDEDDTQFVCRWISDDVKLDDWGNLLDENLKPKMTKYLLWGEPLFEGSEWLAESDNLIWYQTRIPKKLKYPIEPNLAREWDKSTDKTPLVLKVCEYKQNGQTMFERFICLERYKSPDEKEKKEEGKS